MKMRSIFGKSLSWTLAVAAVLVSIRVQAGETAYYKGLNTNVFLKSWLVLSPLPVIAGEAKAANEEAQKKAFDTDFLAGNGGESGVQPKEGASARIGGHDFTWQRVQSEHDEIHLLPPGTTNDNAIAYAWAQIEMPESQAALFALGSDDAVKVWLNGKRVHENWTKSGMDKDRDIVGLDLVKGTNNLLLKIQNRDGDWGFVCRFVDSNGVAERLVTAAARADLDKAKLLLSHGIDVNTRWHGVTPLQAARIAGDREMEDFLKSKGADATLPMPEPEKVIDSVLSEVTRGESSGVAVLVARDGKILFEKGYGFANIENSVPVTPETKFRIGSITKQFTAAAILRLQEKGKLNVTNTLAQYIPDFPRGGEVTLRHLLTHTSGIHSYTSKPDFMENARLGTTPEALIDSIKKDPFDFSPGEKWDYCNSGYFLLGWIVEKVSGQPYAEYLKKEFFEPLGMNDTGIHTATAILKHEATGYSYENGKFQKAMNWDMSKAGGAGAIYSTVGDLFRWNEAVFNGKVLSEASLEAAFTPVITKQDTDLSGKKETGYGYGWGVGNLRGLKAIGHGGGLHGFLSDLARYPGQKFTVVVLANALVAPSGLVPSAIAAQLAPLYLWREMKAREIPSTVAVAPESLAAFVGRYDYGGPVLTVTREDNRLFAQLTGQGKLEIFPKSADTFFWKVVEAEVKFVKNDKGEVIKAIHKQSGMTINAAKMADEKEIKLSPAVLDAYVGKYDYGKGKAVMTVTREGDHLYAQLTGQPKFEIFAKSETEFFWKIVVASVTFVKDDSGKVTRATHHQAGQTIEAPRME
jgi:CubicO group peptidase (beta-lactamase class C family)